ncbi:D-glycerate dehydrogenase [Patescibacteria group bacterium]|nr:D-glycerate dehydrogenase [Patescibacteria group bacterium]MBU1952695.1 D-glycerate dehydrogenase [Patescibacteria group bacterium]
MKVLITREIPQAGINLLTEHKNLELDYRKGAPLSPAELKKAIKDADAIIPVIPDQINKSVFEVAKNLKVVATYSVGYDNIDLDEATKKNIYVANTPGDLTEAVAEHALSMMLGLGRRLAEADKFCRDGKYKYWDPMTFIGPKFMGKTLGIIGFGRIGQFFSRMAKHGLNMKILYYDIAPHPEAENLLDAEKVSLDYLLQNSDVISLHVNLSEETKHMIDSAQFELMKPGAILINTARGPVIDENALALALKENYIAGAALDVFEEEPKIHPDLLKLNNVLLTPHIASATWEARIQMARMAAENVIDVLINKNPPKYLVNKELLKDSVSSIA